jgi:hypothetical protein
MRPRGGPATPRTRTPAFHPAGLAPGGLASGGRPTPPGALCSARPPSALHRHAASLCSSSMQLSRWRRAPGSPWPCARPPSPDRGNSLHPTGCKGIPRSPAKGPGGSPSGGSGGRRGATGGEKAARRRRGGSAHGVPRFSGGRIGQGWGACDTDRLTISSGFVSRDLTAATIRERWEVVRSSGMHRIWGQRIDLRQSRHDDN